VVVVVEAVVEASLEALGLVRAYTCSDSAATVSSINNGTNMTANYNDRARR